MSKLNVYGVQLDPVWEDKAASIKRAEGLLTLANPRPGSLILLPEMFSTGFSMDVEKIYERGPNGFGEAAGFAKETATQFKSTVIAGVVERGPGETKGRNVALVAEAGKSEPVAKYSKCFPFPPSGESEHYAAGDAPVIFNCGDFKVAPLICYDLRFPEIFRLAAKMGANLMTVIASWPAVREKHWVTLLQARAIENQAFVAAVNRCGKDPLHSYSGRSLIINPLGEIIADAGNGQTVIHAEIDSNEADGWREKFPALRNMRADIFEKVSRL